MIRPGRKQTNWQPHGYQGFGFFIHGLWSGSPPDTRGRSPVRKSRTPGSVRGVSGNGYPYRDILWTKFGRRSILKNVKIRAGIARSSSIAYTFRVDVTQCVLRQPTAKP